MRLKKTIVRIYAIGSLLPLSNSRVGRICPFSASFFDRRIEKTAAASVEDTIEPRRSASKSVKSVTHHTNNPRMPAVINTPSTERVSAWPKTGLTEVQSVSNPPENRMKLSATTPMNCAIPGLSKGIPPIPSLPANIPTARKSISVGIPSRNDVFPARMLMKSKTEATSIIFSIVRSGIS